MSTPGGPEDKRPFEERLRMTLQDTEPPTDLSPDPAAALHQGRRVLRRRRIATGVAGTAAALALVLGLSQLSSPFGTEETPPATDRSTSATTTDHSPSPSWQQLTLTAQGTDLESGQPVDVDVNVTVTSGRLKITWKGESESVRNGPTIIPLPTDGTDVLMGGDSSLDQVAFAVLQDRPESVTIVDGQGNRGTKAPSVDSTQIPGSDQWVVVVMAPEEDPPGGMDSITWTDRSGEQHTVPHD